MTTTSMRGIIALRDIADMLRKNGLLDKTGEALDRIADDLEEQLETLSGVSLFGTDDGGWQLELHDKGWDAEITLHPDGSTEFYAHPWRLSQEVSA